MNKLQWNTAVSKVNPNKILLRGYPLDELMGKITFSQAIYLVLKGEMPSPEIGRLMDAVFVSSVDHGAGPPSVLTARTIASTGAELNAALAGGILAISRYHGGAIEAAMQLYAKIGRRMDESGEDMQTAVRDEMAAMKAAKKRASGFGHRVHTRDPRTSRLFSLAEELDLAGKHVAIARQVEKELKELTGRALPINVDGAIAALLCDLDIPSEIGNAFFIIARTAGLTAQIHEEKSRMRPMRKIHPEDFTYDGPGERKI